MNRTKTPSVETASSPLLCTADDALLDVLLDWCSAVGTVPDVVRDAGMAQRLWRGAQLVLVGDDLAAEIARNLPPRRPAVFVVARGGRPWDQAVALGAEDVLDATDRDRALAALTAAVDGGGEACVVAVVGGVGGVGASCLAATLALEAGRRGLRVLLVDGDPLGGGLDVLLGIEKVEGVRWPKAGAQSGAVTSRSLTEALPQTGNVWVLTAGRPNTAGDLTSAVGLLSAARRGFDVVVCDVDRHVDSLGSELLAHALLTVVVVPEDVRSLAAATSVIQRVSSHASSLAVVTAHRRPGLARDTIEATLGLPVIAQVRLDRRLQEALDHGVGPGGSSALRRAVRPLLDIVGAA
ncbi:MAG TPA: septum site-determining protein Ssd [Aeromicrobium sp.]|nr:septum site-determining protein Ssd [Aeromicrobium sp.]